MGVKERDREGQEETEVEIGAEGISPITGTGNCSTVGQSTSSWYLVGSLNSTSIASPRSVNLASTTRHRVRDIRVTKDIERQVKETRVRETRGRVQERPG